MWAQAVLSVRGKQKKSERENRLKMGNKLQIKIGKKIKFVDFDEIFFFKADNKYVEIGTFSKKYLISTSINELEETLPFEFRRIHRSCIVNSNHVEEIIPYSKSTYSVIIKDKAKTTLSMSRNYKDNLI